MKRIKKLICWICAAAFLLPLNAFAQEQCDPQYSISNFMIASGVAASSPQGASGERFRTQFTLGEATGSGRLHAADPTSRLE